jgi:hypothetical protein
MGKVYQKSSKESFAKLAFFLITKCCFKAVLQHYSQNNSMKKLKSFSKEDFHIHMLYKRSAYMRTENAGGFVIRQTTLVCSCQWMMI